jgi:hypothetical protein
MTSADPEGGGMDAVGVAPGTDRKRRPRARWPWGLALALVSLACAWGIATGHPPTGAELVAGARAALWPGTPLAQGREGNRDALVRLLSAWSEDRDLHERVVDVNGWRLLLDDGPKEAGAPAPSGLLVVAMRTGTMSVGVEGPGAAGDPPPAWSGRSIRLIAVPRSVAAHVWRYWDRWSEESRSLWMH